MNSFIFLFALHKLFALTFLVGLLFFVVWTIKNLKKNDLIKLAVSLIAIGVLGSILVMTFGGFKSYKDGKGYKGYNHSGIFKCMKDDSCRSEMDSLMEKKGLK